jgi:hypothetical protein
VGAAFAVFAAFAAPAPSSLLAGREVARADLDVAAAIAVPTARAATPVDGRMPSSKSNVRADASSGSNAMS